MTPQSMSQMYSPEWLEGDTAQVTQATTSQPHQCPGPGKRAGTLREDEDQQRKHGEDEGKQKEKGGEGEKVKTCQV